MTRNVQTRIGEIASATRGGNVQVSAVLPPGFDPARGPYPLLISLHGGGGNRDGLINQASRYETFFADDVLPPLVVVSFSAGPASFYTGWEAFILGEFTDWAGREFNAGADGDGLGITGLSMGGYGALMMALKFPDRFRAVAGMEPAIEPGYSRGPNYRRGTWWRNLEAEKDRWGSPVDDRLWEANNPATIARDNAQTIRTSGLEIYLEAGDEDYAHLHDGAEFLHRVLWDHDIRHEYHLVRWADHVGPSFPRRIHEAHVFLGEALTGGRKVRVDLPLTELEQAYADYMVNGGIVRGEAPPDYTLDATSEVAPTINSAFFRPMKEIALKEDPAMQRAYAELPPTR